MKKLLFVVFVFSVSLTFAQEFDYDAHWDSIVHREEAQGQLKSLLPAVEEIYTQAKETTNYPQQIKALLYRAKIQLATADGIDNQVAVFSEFAAEMQEAEGVSKHVMQSMLAEMYTTYYSRHASVIAQRTSLKTAQTTDFRYWTNVQFQEKINSLYQQSVKEKTALQNTPITDWKLLLHRKHSTEKFRPTVYDFLVHRAVDFYTSSRYSYALAPEKPIEKSKALLQSLIAFHQAQHQSAATAYNAFSLLELQRDKLGDQVFVDKLTALTTRYGENDYTPFLYLKLANFYRQAFRERGDEVSEKREKLIKKALHYSDLILKRYPEEEKAVGLAKAIKKSIVLPILEAQVEAYVSPDRPIPMAVTYKNMDRLYVRVVRYEKSADSLLFALRHAEDEDRQQVLHTIFEQLETVKTAEIALREFLDYQARTTLVKLPALPVGRFFVFLATTPTFDLATAAEPLGVVSLKVSPYALAFRDNAVVLTNRQTGEFLADRTIRAYTQRNDSLTLWRTLKTNTFGEAKVDLTDNQYLKFKVEDGAVFFKNYMREPTAITEGQKTTMQTQIFTDRKIYRPGQRVYIKAVAYTQSASGKRQVSANRELHLTLVNPNHEEVKTLSLTTNEFGSVSGEFMLPTSGLTGQYYLKSSFGEASGLYRSRYYFSVEAYKRPKFEVSFTPVKGVFELGREVTVHGKAEAYSGADLSQAMVNYRVVRQPIYPYLPWWRQRPYQSPVTLEQGTMQTTTDGEFEIEFTAIPDDEQQEQADQPRTYRYRIVAEVTDVNGETHEAEQTLVVGDWRYELTLPIADKIELTKLDTLPIVTKNLNGKLVAAQGAITLTKINPPQRVLRDSPFPEMDMMTYDRDTFINYFPHLAYGAEYKKKNWKKGEVVLKQTFDTEDSQGVAVDTKDWTPGYYRLKAAIVDGQDTIPAEKLVFLYRDDYRKPVDYKLFAIHADKTTYHPGEEAEIQLVSAADRAEVLVQVEANGQLVESKLVKLRGRAKTVRVPIKTDYTGKVYVHYYFTKYNTAKSGSLALTVADTEAQLDVTLTHFHSTLKPGNEETWTVHVEGDGKDGVLAELLATMYDASLDQFKPNSIQFALHSPVDYARVGSWQASRSFGTNSLDEFIHRGYLYRLFDLQLQFDRLNWFGLYRRGYASKPILYFGAQRNAVPPAPSRAQRIQLKTEMAKKSFEASQSDKLEEPKEAVTAVVPRRALQETAFFYPELHTDEQGNVNIQFTVPESLTQWKFMIAAHTKTMETAYLEQLVRTQKKLMVSPNPPRFLREGDRVVFSTKITNLSAKTLNGTAKLELFDAFTMQPISADFGLTDTRQSFAVRADNSTAVSWVLTVPKTHRAVVYRVTASAGNFTDGVESALPVLTNRKLITETLPIHLREGETKTMSFDKLKQSASTSLENFKLTFELTTAPIWQAVFALPSLSEPQNESSTSVFAQVYANLIATKISNANPKINAVFENWRQQDLLESNLQRNQALKEVMLNATPWVQAAESEQEQMKRIALLFDLNRMQQQRRRVVDRLTERQSSTGGFPWFEGGDDNRQITTTIVSGIGHLNALGISTDDFASMLRKAIAYLDTEALQHYRLKQVKDETYGYAALQYLYARSFFLEDYPLPENLQNFKTAVLADLRDDKFDLPLQQQAMAALVLQRYGKHNAAKAVLLSVKDHAVTSEARGMYWKENTAGWHWYQAPIATQALLIEAFDQVLGDIESVEAMKVWLLMNRQVNQWPSTRATSEAVYALLNTGRDWTNSQDGVTVKVGRKSLNLDSLSLTQGSGVGYVKTSWNAAEMNSEMGTVTLSKTSPGVAWGALYWQYYEDLDQVTAAESGIQLEKQLFLKKMTEKGLVLQPITANTPIEVGDLVAVRLKIKTDRNLAFVHLKAMRASGFEPVNVLSGYTFQDGLGYYESTRDAATHFFIDHLPKGAYVFEYELRANNAGDFSEGIITIENMYAPELGAHSRGSRVIIK